MIDGMSEICIDCVHQEVCRYECHCPSGHCNDRAVADDFIPQGEWIEESSEVGAMNIKYTWYKCSKCGFEHSLAIPKNFCPNCGMRGGTKCSQTEK